MVTSALGVPRVFLAIQVHRVRLVRRALKDTQAHVACKALGARRALRGRTETEDHWVVATGALRVHKAMKALRETRANQAPKEEAPLDLKEARGNEESQAEME